MKGFGILNDDEAESFREAHEKHREELDRDFTKRRDELFRQ